VKPPPFDEFLQRALEECPPPQGTEAAAHRIYNTIGNQLERSGALDALAVFEELITPDLIERELPVCDVRKDSDACQ